MSIGQIELIKPTPLIGLIGPIGGGKSYQSRLFKHDHGYEIINFADKVRETCWKLIGWKPFNDAEYESFKLNFVLELSLRYPEYTTPATRQIEGSWIRPSTATQAPQEVYLPFPVEQVDPKSISNRTVFNQLTGRELLENIGDGFRHLYGEFFWIDRWLDTIEKYDHVVCGDVRYPNEAFTILQNGGKLYFSNYPSERNTQEKRNNSIEQLSTFFALKYPSESLENEGYIKELTLQDIEYYSGTTLQKFVEANNR